MALYPAYGSRGRGERLVSEDEGVNYFGKAFWELEWDTSGETY